jgi:hypothetical protein
MAYLSNEMYTGRMKYSKYNVKANHACDIDQARNKFAPRQLTKQFECKRFCKNDFVKLR